MVNEVETAQRWTDEKIEELLEQVQGDINETKPSSSPTGLFREHSEDLCDIIRSLRQRVLDISASRSIVAHDFNELAVEADRLREKVAQLEAEKGKLSATILRLTQEPYDEKE